MNTNFQVIEVSGILDGIRGNQLRREISELIADGNNIVLLDMNSVTFMDSSGLGSLVSAMQMLRSVNSQLFICSMNDQVKMLFELTKMNRIFQTFINQDDFKRQVLTATRVIS